ncbi:SymE family type I addiction module toxin [Pantoea sp. 1.19]|uniref:SymE family type I addiction module toxin n=1 Tax=Pantoea sp. 1.19 TaxID=1925589 RepID=UPI000948B91D|nr:SymE family type I addiction module toxin [Pantoea sp. 1.19]
MSVPHEDQQELHHYTVGYTPNGYRGNPSPRLIISGRWLEKFGFDTGHPVIVEARRGQLVIRTELNI